MNRMGPSSRMTRIELPPVGRIMGRIGEMRAEGREVHSLAQAVPWYSPPSRCLDSIGPMMHDPVLHRYSPDPGYIHIRIAVTEDLRDRRGIDLDPEESLHLTCGASQAFLSALLACTSVGDRVAVVEPYYFDHVFAIEFSGLERVSIPMIDAGDSWEMPMEAILSMLPDLKVLVLVNPGNPTGSVIMDHHMRKLVEASADTGTFLLIDETYERFVFTADRWHPWMDGETGHVLTFGSFSKSLGMAGWRIGYLFGEGSLMEQALKVQDSVVICPPSPSQVLLGSAIREKRWIQDKVDGVRLRRDLCRKALERGSGDLRWKRVDGAFFTLASYPGDLNSDEVAMHVLEEYGIGTVPGSAFGASGEGHLRISFGCLADADIEPVMEILGRVTVPC